MTDLFSGYFSLDGVTLPCNLDILHNPKVHKLTGAWQGPKQTLEMYH